MTTRARFAGILTAITMTAAMAACSANSGESDASSDGGMSSGEVSGGSDSLSAAAPESAQDADASTSKSFNSSDAASTVQNQTTPPTERAVISTGTVSLRSKNVAEARRDVQRVIDEQGGEVTEESTETDDEGTTSYSRLVVRVPSSKFSTAMSALEAAAEMSSSNRGGEDVTTQIIDTDVRVRAQEASLKRVELLLSRAQSLKDIIWIESQLTNRQAELDSLKSQQAWLKDQTSLSTITVDISKLTKKDVVEEDEEDEAGFLVGLKGGMNALVASAAAVLTIVGALLPFAVLALLVGFPVWLLVRRRKGPQPQPQPPAPQPQS